MITTTQFCRRTILSTIGKSMICRRSYAAVTALSPPSLLSTSLARRTGPSPTTRRVMTTKKTFQQVVIAFHYDSSSSENGVRTTPSFQQQLPHQPQQQYRGLIQQSQLRKMSSSSSSIALEDAAADSVGSEKERQLKEVWERHEHCQTPDEIKTSLESIRTLQFLLERWKDTLRTEQELYTNFYAKRLVPQEAEVDDQSEQQKQQKQTQLLDIAKSHNRMGICNQRMGLYEEAKHHFTQSLTAYQHELLHKDMFHVNVGYAWNALAALEVEVMQRKLQGGETNNLVLALEHLDMAEPHFRHHDKHMFRDELDEDQEPHVTGLREILDNKAKIMRLNGEHRPALQLYREVEELLMMYASSQLPDRDLLLDLADCLISIGNYDEAHELYTKVLDQKLVDSDTLMDAAVHHQLGLIHATQQEPQLALPYFQHAYNIRKRCLDDMANANNTSGTAATTVMGQSMNAMGTVQANLGNFHAALSYFREALVMARIHTEFNPPEDDPVIKNILKNIKLVQRNMGQSTFS